MLSKIDRDYGTPAQIRRMVAAGLATPVGSGYELDDELLAWERNDSRASIPSEQRQRIYNRDGNAFKVGIPPIGYLFIDPNKRNVIVTGARIGRTSIGFQHNNHVIVKTRVACGARICVTQQLIVDHH